MSNFLSFKKKAQTLRYIMILAEVRSEAKKIKNM